MALPVLPCRREVLRSFRHRIGKTAVIYPSAFLVALGMTTLSLTLNFHLKDVYQATGLQVGAFFALWSLWYITGCLLVRPWTDAVQPRYLLVTATLRLSVSAAGQCFCRRMDLAFVLCAVNGLSASIFWPPPIGSLARPRAPS